MPINLNGPVTSGTRQNLIDGLRGRAMSASAVDQILTQATEFTGQLVDTYEAEIAASEVGANGSALASVEPIIGDRSPTVLMYGRVQSGKTAAMILTTARCLDNGFRIIVVLTADNVALVRQTADRFKALNGPRVFSTYKEEAYEWEGQEEELRQEITQDGLVLVCAKDAFHLPQVLGFLQAVGASYYPAIVFDDEADAATPDTTLAARSSGRANAPEHPSTIHRRIIENSRPGEEGESISENLPHALYVQVTATPYVLFLQTRDSRIRPNRTLLVEPGVGYSGGEAFFGAFNPTHTTVQPPLSILPDTEMNALVRREVPSGLAESINFFILSAVVYAQGNGWPHEGLKHLSHPSHRTQQHSVVSGHISSHLHEVRTELRTNEDAAIARFTNAHTELLKTRGDLQPLRDLIPAIRDAMRQQYELMIINGRTDVPVYGPRLNFLVGGNILGRGLTIDNLLVTYYVREAQVSQMDTIWQHARMYGYRAALMPYTRVYLPRRVAARFKATHEAEEELRALLQMQIAGEDVPIRIAGGTRATRPNALDASTIRVIRQGTTQIYPVFLNQTNRNRIDAVTGLLRDAQVAIDVQNREQRFTRVSREVVDGLIATIPVNDDDTSRWSLSTIRALLGSFNDTGLEWQVYARPLEEAPPAEGWSHGRLSGPESVIIQNHGNGVPVLALMYLGTANNPTAWYPTLVLPAGTPNYILNIE